MKLVLYYYPAMFPFYKIMIAIIIIKTGWGGPGTLFATLSGELMFIGTEAHGGVVYHNGDR